MHTVLAFRDVTKRFGRTTALQRVSLSISRGSVVGLVGRNGSGKTTLLRHAIGLYLPDTGTCVTLGRDARDLGPAELTRIGMVHQRSGFLYWMTVEQQIRYIASFYPGWDVELERRLVGDLELDATAKVGGLSPGNLQKLSLVTAVCHHPDLLLLDEPISALDPVTRQRTLRFLLERLTEDEHTIVISSHVLRDIEQIVSHLVCLQHGRVVADASLDDLREQFAEWLVTARGAALPATFPEPFVLAAEHGGRRARLVVRDAAPQLEAFRNRYDVEVEPHPLNLESLFPHLLEVPNDV